MRTYPAEVAASLREGETFLSKGDVEICRLALAEYALNLHLWRRRYGRLALGLLAGGAIGALATFGASRAWASELHCQRIATGETVCDNGARAYRNAVGETVIRRHGERPLRCARTATGVACNDR